MCTTLRMMLNACYTCVVYSDNIHNGSKQRRSVLAAIHTVVGDNFINTNLIHVESDLNS